MKDNFEALKKEYKNIPVPENLNDVINRGINNYRKEKKRMKNKKIFKSIIAASLLILSSFTIGVNTSESFAMTAEKIPGVSVLVKLVSFESFKIEDEVVNANVNIPAVEGFESETVEEQINQEIQEKMNMHLEEGKLKAKENKEAFIETGGKEEDYRPMIIEIDYSLKSSIDNQISFAVHYFESMASSYSKTYYYTIDLEEDKLLTLKDLLGKNYEDKINQQITEVLEESPSEYFQGEMGFKGISENQNFYINDANQIVVVFDKYEIAPGSSGEPEFIIEE